MKNTFFPGVCLLCDVAAVTTNNLCTACHNSLPILTHYCPRCANILPTNASLACGSCLISPPPYEKTFALFKYQDAIVHLISQLKFNGQLTHAKFFSETMRVAIKTQWYLNRPLPDLIIPVPLHPSKLKERGFNQAVVLAKSIAKDLNVAFDPFSLKRIKPTYSQTRLNAKDREKNMLHAFSSRYDYSHLTVAVLDDVITTSHTMRACCRVIKERGAKEIHVWCVART